MALKAYNTAAGAIGAEKLDFKTVIDYAFVSQFDLLRDARQDIRSKPWSKAANRFLMDKLFERDHVREEILRLNIEITCLRTWIRDEDMDFRATISSMHETNPNLASEIEAQARRRFRIHEHLLQTLRSLKRTPGYTGTCTPGQSITRASFQSDLNSNTSPSTNSETMTRPRDSQHDPNEDSDADAEEDRLDRVVNAFGNMI